MLRKVMLRPSWCDHPNFTGSNPEVASLVDAFNAGAKRRKTNGVG